MLSKEESEAPQQNGDEHINYAVHARGCGGRAGGDAELSGGHLAEALDL